MAYDEQKFRQFLEFLRKYSTEENLNRTDIVEFVTYKHTDRKPRKSNLDQSVIWVIGQGEKLCYIGDQVFRFKPGQVLVLVYPMAVEVETVTASEEEPFLAAGLGIRRDRITNLLVRLDYLEGPEAKGDASHPSGIFSFPLNDEVLEMFIRLFHLLKNPLDLKMLAPSTVDETYYRVLKYDAEGNIQTLLKHNGAFQRISKAVEYVNENLNLPLTSEDMADIAHMSHTTFYEHFKKVMHVTPLHYIKSVKLHEARKLLRLGNNVSETAQMIGYGSYSQFSREFKRRYGQLPSQV